MVYITVQLSKQNLVHIVKSSRDDLISFPSEGTFISNLIVSLLTYTSLNNIWRCWACLQTCPKWDCATCVLLSLLFSFNIFWDFVIGPHELKAVPVELTERLISIKYPSLSEVMLSDLKSVLSLHTLAVFWLVFARNVFSF